jgi:hypothetical protein
MRRLLAVVCERDADFRGVRHGEIGLGAADDRNHHGSPAVACTSVLRPPFSFSTLEMAELVVC